jgi:DNA-binding transcriptional regulator YiaG
MKKKYVNEALMVCHHLAESFLQMGIIDADEMREIDKSCLALKPEVSPEVEKFIKMGQKESR